MNLPNDVRHDYPNKKMYIISFDSDNQDNKGYTALIIACQNGYADLAMALLDKGAAVDYKTKVSALDVNT